jgi:hypothetical protein
MRAADHREADSVIDIVPVSFALGAAGVLPSGRGGVLIGASHPKINTALTTLEDTGGIARGRDRSGRRKAVDRRHGMGRMLK